MMLRQRPGEETGYRCRFICVIATLATGIASAQEPAGTPAPGGQAAIQATGAAVPGSKRPRVGLALAGGGARGGAHIGVLKVLEELRVPIDCIAGTSMGALVGGGYASGMPAADIEKLVTNVEWKSVVGGVGSRKLEPVEQKRFNDSSGSIELGLKDGKI